MNQAMKVTIPKHIDPREVVKETPTAEIINMTFMMQDNGTTPYRYLRRALMWLVKGDYERAYKWLDYAAKFDGVFWPEDSEDNKAYRITIKTWRVQFYFLPEKFKELRPENDPEE